ncbi:MAG TPA: FGGY family carbohydrate kinase [Streptosporangiaceae bacterium]|nr:FGGY family carbohydrate kinase [Streptosporangiaceae bacterium]
MAPEYVIAIDIGTQSTRAALVDGEGSIQDIAASPLDLHAPRPGWAEQDPGQWWDTTVANLAAVMERNPYARIEAVGVGAQMHSVVGCDAAGAAVTDRAAIWSDKRSLEQVTEFLANPDAEYLSRLAGNRPLPAWAGFKMAWLRSRLPAAYEAAACLLVAKDYLNLRLCGAMATDPSEASGSFLCDAATGAWSPELLAAVGVDRSKLPEIVDSAAVIGTVGADVAHRTGLTAGTPVVAGAGDMLCQLLAAGITITGRVGLVTGTASIMAAAAGAASSDQRVMNLRSASGGWVWFGISDAAGQAFRWSVDLFRGESATAAEEPAAVDFDAATKLAASVEPGSGGLLFFPYLLGERTLGSAQARASFVGASLGHDRAHFIRAVLEGITLEDRRALECICPDGVQGAVRCTGGGAGSDLWNQMRADIFGLPVQTMALTEGGILGAAILAAVGAGWYRDAAAAAEHMVRPADVWAPQPDAAAAYQQVYRRFCAVHDALTPVWAQWSDGERS